MQHLNAIYIISYLFRQKIQIQLKDYLFCKRNAYEFYINAHAFVLFRKSNILKLPDKIAL